MSGHQSRAAIRIFSDILMCTTFTPIWGSGGENIDLTQFTEISGNRKSPQACSQLTQEIHIGQN